MPIKTLTFEKRRFSGGFAVALTILILAVAAIAFVIVFGSLSIRNIKLPEYEFGRGAKDAQINNLNNLSSSDELGAIEKDVEETNLENLDQEIKEVENEASGL